MVGETLVLNADGMPVSVLPVSSLIWQDAIKSIWVGAVKVLENYEDWQVHSPSITMPVPSVVITNRYINPAHGVQFNADNIKLRDRYKCAYCQKSFHENDLTLDHVTPKTFGGRSTWENLVSACSPCNNNRGCDFRIQPTIKPYKPNYYQMVALRREFPLEVPHESWVQYLDWPEDNIVVKTRRRRSKARNGTDNVVLLKAA
jgi:5-methylcytosine-specific restriction endonuclease McrA